MVSSYLRLTVRSFTPSPRISAPFNGYLKLQVLLKLNRRGKSRQNNDLRSHTGNRTRNLSSNSHRIKRPRTYQHFPNPCFINSSFCNTAYWQPLNCINAVWFLTDRFYWSDEQAQYFFFSTLKWSKTPHGVPNTLPLHLFINYELSQRVRNSNRKYLKTSFI